MSQPPQIARIGRRRTDFQYTLCYIIEYAAALHNHHTRGDLVGPVGGRQLLHCERPELVHAHS